MIRSNQITLSALTESEVSEEYLETLNDSDYLKYSQNAKSVHTLSSQTKYISEFNQSNNLLFGVKNTKDGKLLGTINCYIDLSKMTLSLGFLIFKNHHGKGLASKALGLLLSYLELQFPGLTVAIGTDKNNLAMQKVAKKHNFTKEVLVGHETEFRFLRALPRLPLESTPLIPDFILRTRNIGIVAFDAGGAEQISWLVKNIPQRVTVLVDGPARNIFSRLDVPFKTASHLKAILECDLIITGSGWMSQVEITAIKEAKSHNTPCITILDHWVNYLERFGKDEESQPNHIAVTNAVALRLAQENFPNKVVWLLPDFQIISYRETIQHCEELPSIMLILLDPISISGSLFHVNLKIIEELIESAIRAKNAYGLASIVIRVHPAQMADDLLVELLAKFSTEVQISKNLSLLEDLKISKIVLGLNSYALYVSSQCKILTFSCFAGKNGHWTNSFPEILIIDF